MPALRIDPEQRFSCRSCARCCRLGWEIPVTAAEAETYRTRHAERWFKETAEAGEGAERDPFDPTPGGLFVIRKRPDGVCGFLSDADRCRLHEELGADRKPLACRMFPFRLHPTEADTVVTASFACPTVARSDGEPVHAQGRALSRLRTDWSAAYPEKPRALAYADGRPIEAASATVLRDVLQAMLDRRDDDGRLRLRANVDRMARTLEDLARWRVTRLPPEEFAEYLQLTGRHAAKSASPLAPRPPSRLGRLLFRGFLLLVLAGPMQRRHTGVFRLGLRLRLAHLLFHLHGLAPATAAIDVRAARRYGVDVDDPEIQPLVHHYLRSLVAALGAGRRPMVEEMAVGLAVLESALLIAASRAARAKAARVDRKALVEALTDAAEITHVDADGIAGRLSATFAGGPEALYRFAAG